MKSSFPSLARRKFRRSQFYFDFKSEKFTTPQAIDKASPWENVYPVNLSFHRLIAHKQTLCERAFIGYETKPLEIISRNIPRGLYLYGYFSINHKIHRMHLKFKQLAVKISNLLA